MPIRHQLIELVPMPIRQIYRRGRSLSTDFKIKVETKIAQINPEPILILGNQKSGTSAIAALLAQMTNLSVSVDLPIANRSLMYKRVKAGELSFDEFVKLNKLEFSKEIVKEPGLTVFYEELKAYFPKSKYIFVLRDPRDNIRSILDRLKIPGNLEQLQPEHTEKMFNSWPLVMDGRWLGIQGDNYIEMLAGRWNFLADIYSAHQDQMLLVRYEDFLKDKVGNIESVAKYLALKPVKNIADKVDVQYQPKGTNRNVKWGEFFSYENLNRIDHLCGERMKLFNYPLSSEIQI